MERPLTARQREVLAAIVSAWAAGGPLPTTREIADRFGWASNHSAAEHIDRLLLAGALRRPRPCAAYGLHLQHPEVARLVSATVAARLDGRTT